MRLFTAIDLPAEIETNLRALLNRLRPMAKLSWTTVDRLHITTKFIGEWPEENLEAITRTLSSVGSPGVVEIALRGIGWFPNPRFPRVLWAGVDGGAPLQSLAHATEEALHGIGIPVEDRAYSPHLTLARIRERVPLDSVKRTIDALESTEFGSFQAPAFYLYLSRGGKYSKLAEFDLA